MPRRLIGLIAVACIALAGCQIFPTPAQLGCTQEEALECSVLQASATVKAAAVTVGEQLDAQLVTPAEARRLTDLIKQARDAVTAAETAIPLADGTLPDRLKALNAALLALLREQVIKEGL